MDIVTTQSGSGSSTSRGNPASRANPVPASRQQSERAQGGSAAWTESLRRAIRTADELAQVLELPPPSGAEQGGARDFPVFVPREFAAKMHKGDPTDPLLLQVWPQAAEGESAEGFTDDPVGDAAATLRPGVLQKYHGRALLVVSPACAVHCRYCFRRHFPYHEGPRGLAAWEEALDAIAGDSSISEVILSGGDPLMVVDEVLAPLVSRIAEIGHVRRLRVHTRLPIVIPARVTAEMLTWLGATRLQGILVVHANHPRELDAEVLTALGRVRGAGIPVLNQSVLLRGVNDSAETLIGLSERLIDGGIMPYYLHQLDRVRGAAHFEVDKAAGRRLIETMRTRLPGYAVPKYVEEIAGDLSKRAIE